MLDLGFLEDVEKILALTPNSRQTALFSATMPPPIRKLADRYLYDPVHRQGQGGDADRRLRRAVRARGQAAPTRPTSSSRSSRPSAPTRRSSSCARRSAATSSTASCATAGMNVKALHGDMSQGSRDGVMLSFKGGRVPILVATDVAARGLDISTVTHVINFDVPTSPDVYVHRIGRTGRVGRSGRAITFVEPRQKKRAGGDRAAHRDGDRAVGARAPGRARGGRASARAATPSRSVSRNGDEPYASCSPAAGRAEGLEVADIVHAVTVRRRPRRRGGPRRQGARALRLLLACPSGEAERVVARSTGRGRGTSLRVELARRVTRRRVTTLPRRNCGALRTSERGAWRISEPRPMRPRRPDAAAGAGDGPAASADRSPRRPGRARSAAPPLAPGQDWCLECGTAAPGRLGGAPRHARRPSTIAVLHARCSSAAPSPRSYAALSTDANARRARRRPARRRPRRPTPAPVIARRAGDHAGADGPPADHVAAAARRRRLPLPLADHAARPDARADRRASTGGDDGDPDGRRRRPRHADHHDDAPPAAPEPPSRARRRRRRHRPVRPLPARDRPRADPAARDRRGRQDDLVASRPPPTARIAGRAAHRPRHAEDRRAPSRSRRAPPAATSRSTAPTAAIADRHPRPALDATSTPARSRPDARRQQPATARSRSSSPRRAPAPPTQRGSAASCCGSPRRRRRAARAHLRAEAHR